MSNDDQLTKSSEKGTTTGLGECDVEHGCDESVDVLRDRIDGKITGIKEHFGFMVDRRDREITDLKASNAQRRLLVIDDSPSTVDILNGYLKNQRIELVGCSGTLARGLLESEDFDAIMIEESVVVDATVDGLALCRQLCEEGRGDTLIVMSARPGKKISKGRREKMLFALPPELCRKASTRLSIAKRLSSAVWKTS